MILFGCLLAFGAAVAPRVILILAWIFGARWDAVWQGDFLLPLLGIIFLPYTTIMYLLAWSPAVAGGGNIEGFDWFWILMGLLLDFMKWGQMLANRKEAQSQATRYYPSGAPKSPTGTGGAGVASATMSTGSVQASTSPSAPDADTTGADTDAESPSGSDPEGSGEDKKT